MTLRALALLSALTLLASTGTARAGIGSATVDIKVWLPDDDGKYQQSNEIERIDFFNFAHCQCAIEQPATDTPGPGTFQVELSLETNGEVIGSGEEGELTVGTNCDNDDFQVRRCESIQLIPDVRSELDSSPRFNVDADQLMFPNIGSCDNTTGAPNVYVLFDDDNDGTIEQTFSSSYSFDAQAPPLPTGISASGAEGGVQVSWDELESRQGEIEYYQVLCARADGTPAFPSPREEAEYDTAFGLCGSSTRVPVSSQPSGGGPDAGVMADAGSEVDAAPGPDAGAGGGAAIPEWMATLNQDYVCATQGQSARSIRVNGLENGQAYRIALITVDDARNVAAIDLGEVTPQPVSDFWEDYHDQGGSADGGLCLVTSTFGDDHWTARALRAFRDHTLARFALGRRATVAYYEYVAPYGAAVEASAALRVATAVVIVPLAGLAGAWEYTSAGAKLAALAGLLLLLMVRRRDQRRPAPERTRPQRARPRRPLAAAAAVALACAAVALTSAPAYAQSDPYWDVWEPVEDRADPVVGVPHWNFGVRLGPYTPDVDSEFSASPGPYERMYGGAGLMGAVELERFFLYPLGQLGVSASVGLSSKSANAFAICGAGDTGCTPGEVIVEDGVPKRSDGDSTSFRLIPIFVGAVYRFTFIDDQLRVPLVPYARLGVSYYLWWVTAPDGSFAEAPTADCPDLSGCDGDRALGASLGWQATVGLALRAERFDAQAAQSLRNDLGIEHAGIYAELVYADVDGFGADSKLSVGDLTWFGGLNFEF
ncbi:MAG: hypothetical protein Tsb0020_47770 [Haliangiales bacterium]